MKPKSHLRSLILAAGSSLLAISSASAADGTWDTNSGGNWTDVTKWQGDAAYAVDADSTATLGNVISADRTITLDAPITIGKIFAQDTDKNYTISGANTLTLDVSTGAPEIGVVSGRQLTISSKLAGDEGLKKTGPGTLLLRGANTGLSGTIDLQAGRLSAGGATANIALGTEFGSGMIDVTSGAYVRFFQLSNASTVAYANDLTLRGDGNGTGALQNDGNATANHIIWDGTITLAADAQINAQNSGRYTFNGDINQSGGSHTLSLTVNGGPHAINAGLTMGTVTHTGTGAVNFGSASVIDVGTWTSAAGALNFGTATVNSLGTLTTAGDTSLGNANQLTASTILNVQGNFDLGGFNQQSGTFTQTGGTVSNGTLTASSFALNNGTFAAAPGGSGTISLGGGTLQQSDAADHSARFSTAAGQQFRIDVVGTANHVTWATNLTSSGATLAKSGDGILTLSGINTYTGATNVNAGTLLINGSTSSTSLVTVASGATLGGTGTIGGSVSVAGGATLSPGASIESLTTGTLSMVSGSTFAYEVANKSATGADLLGVNGALSLSDVTLSLDSASLLALAGGAWLVGDKLTLISYGGTAITSGFVGFDDDTNYTFGSNVWTFNYNDTLAGNNFASDLTETNRITLTAFTVVPEPSTAILASGLLSLGVLRRRRSA